MRTILCTISGLAVTMLANSLGVEAKSETECRAEAQSITGEIQGLDFTRALTACMLNSPRAVSPPAAVVIEKTEQPTVIEETEQPVVAFPASKGVSSGTWVRLSPNRWTLKR
jgi:hypothetical protein